MTYDSAGEHGANVATPQAGGRAGGAETAERPSQGAAKLPPRWHVCPPGRAVGAVTAGPTLSPGAAGPISHHCLRHGPAPTLTGSQKAARRTLLHPETPIQTRLEGLQD
ncbi:hypothetical protein AAFF_G00283890 [Aldrovandia affinis]|uniref:Uncharacterized protein n=1 Tax=Aldrovandia affinis TaxID=143900 RepID=A0AAD7X1N6_9TELE|nr:hypothetical protein AAFF_G00283890 [Aldrovandia affinis]